MIKINTATSKIIAPDGSLASGTLTVWPNTSYEYNELAGRRKVAAHKISRQITDGLLATALALPPTRGANHDTEGVYYFAKFRTVGVEWTEYWDIAADGPAELEITDIVRVNTSQTPALVLVPGPPGQGGGLQSGLSVFTGLNDTTPEGFTALDFTIDKGWKFLSGWGGNYSYPNVIYVDIDGVIRPVFYEHDSQCIAYWNTSTNAYDLVLALYEFSTLNSYVQIEHLLNIYYVWDGEAFFWRQSGEGFIRKSNAYPNLPFVRESRLININDVLYMINKNGIRSYNPALDIADNAILDTTVLSYDPETGDLITNSAVDWEVGDFIQFNSDWTTEILSKTSDTEYTIGIEYGITENDTAGFYSRPSCLTDLVYDPEQQLLGGRFIMPVVDGDNIYIIGGKWDGSPQAKVHIYNITANTLTEQPYTVAGRYEYIWPSQPVGDYIYAAGNDISNEWDFQAVKINYKTGEVVRLPDLPASVSSFTILEGERIYVRTNNKGLYSFDANNIYRLIRKD